MNNTNETFGKGDCVNVSYREGDMFSHNFTGQVVGNHGDYVTVEDQDGDCWDCEPSQLKFSSDEIMHDNP